MAFVFGVNFSASRQVLISVDGACGLYPLSWVGLSIGAGSSGKSSRNPDNRTDTIEPVGYAESAAYPDE